MTKAIGEDPYPVPRASTYAGLFFVTLATLMLEILLTRIFSVMLWYHFAFMAISVALFGMTAGAIVVYLRPPRFTRQRAPRQLVVYSLAYAVSTVMAFLVYLRIPFVGDASPRGLSLLATSYVIISVPFTFSGMVVSIALTKFPAHVSRLYAADLLGAAGGCLALIYTLELTDGPTAVLVVATFAALGALFFALPVPGCAMRRSAAAAALLLAAAAIGHTALVRVQRPLIELRETRGMPNRGHLYVAWNSFSRVHVTGDPQRPSKPLGWGLSERTASANARIRQLYMGIDVWAGTVLTAFDGDTRPLEFLRDDVTNLVHYLRRAADVLAIGVGGGRDALSALVFDQRSVLGVEINENVLRATTEVFGDFTGHLDRHPKVEFVVDEARSYVTRSGKQFDIIQLSLIDTWAATAAGAFVLSENSLYTVEAWRTFLEHLSPRGVLSVSRWYFPTRPGEIYRLASLARETLLALGVTDPRRHVVIVKMPRAVGVPGKLGNGIGTMLVSREPFTRADLALLRREVKRLGFEFVVTPRSAENSLYAGLLSPTDAAAVEDSLPIDVSAPTDDRPFFFQMLRFRDFARPFATGLDPNSVNLEAIRILGVLLLVVIALTTLCILVPLALTTRRSQLRGATPLLVFFLAIGLGFMLVEISQMQRLMVFLGHPTYALSVVLFTLLVGGGLGSLLTERLGSRLDPGRRVLPLLALLVVLAAFGALTPTAVDALAGATTPVRILTAAGILLSIGLFMGMPFPLGMKAASGHAEGLTPWLWGLNGAASVLCTVVAMVIALTWGIAASFWIGVGCYVVAAAAYWACGSSTPYGRLP